jgi:hypothetical protein
MDRSVLKGNVLLFGIQSHNSYREVLEVLDVSTTVNDQGAEVPFAETLWGQNIKYCRTRMNPKCAVHDTVARNDG